VFFVSTGAGLDISALSASTRAIVLVPVFLAAMLVVRGVPAALYAWAIGRTHACAAGFMQATTLTFIVVATVIGVQTGHQRPATATALVVAGLLSVVIYPPLALRLLRGTDARPVSHTGPPNPTLLSPYSDRIRSWVAAAAAQASCSRANAWRQLVTVIWWSEALSLGFPIPREWSARRG